MLQTPYKKCAGIIIENEKGELLLQLRDENAHQFPNRWVLLGGASENGESPEATIMREIKEETGIRLEGFDYFREFRFDGVHQHMFYKKMDFDADSVNLTEGRKIQFFNIKELKNLAFGFNIKSVLNAFLEEKYGKRID